MKRFCWLWISMVCLALTGCATADHRSTSLPVATGDALADGHANIASGPAKDRVLWQCRAAAAAMRRGQFGEAKQLLDDALLTMGATLVGDKSAKKSRSYFSEESKKTFRGEPYERVMAYYYRGILYWMDGELDNARACFRSAQIQDADAETKQYAADYVLLDYLDGFATAKLGGDGSDALQRASAESKFGNPPVYDKSANTLFFVEFGQGPTKYATGEYQEELRFLPGRSVAQSAVVKIDNMQGLALRPYDDLSFQAMTRGGRVMDHVLANKAVFKSTTDTIGNVGLIGGLAMAGASHDRTMQEAGLGLAAAGLVGKIISAVTTPAADTRTWDNLPQFLTFAAVRLPPGQHTASIEFLDPAGRPLAGLTRNVTLTVVPAKDTVVFISDRPS
jgi:tetratricopeptide (TPR) repeat protein